MMGRRRDITGERFGRLIAKNNTGWKSGTTYIWECQCDCGNLTYVRLNNLNRIKSCGCLLGEIRKEFSKKHSRINIKGERFGKLTVLNFIGIEKRSAIWECQCDCGKLTKASTRVLRSGRKKTCGDHKKRHAKTDDIKGERFGKLVALYFVKTEKCGSFWRCRCDCGNEKEIRRGSLLMGVSRSCGCQRYKNRKRKAKLTSNNE